MPKTGASDAFHVSECCRVIRSGSLHHVHCIMSSYHHVISLFASQVNKLCGSLIHLNRGIFTMVISLYNIFKVSNIIKEL